MRILLTGAGGQVGSAFAPLAAGLGEVLATRRRDLDMANADSIRAVVREVRPDVIVNAAAYTAVDDAESNAPAAFAVNGTAPGVLAEEAKRLGALLVHYSTDYVFDGEKASPYLEDDPPAPVNVYGDSKLAGEKAIRASGCRHAILRTSWLYSAIGRNFLLTILRMAREGKGIRVVDDQVGAPTSAYAVAEATATLLRKKCGDGVFHMTCGGAASWYRFAAEIVARAGLPSTVAPIRTADLPRPARRPRNSRLDCGKLLAASGIRLPEWQDDLSACLARMGAAAGSSAARQGGA